MNIYLAAAFPETEQGRSECAHCIPRELPDPPLSTRGADGQREFPATEPPRCDSARRRCKPNASTLAERLRVSNCIQLNQYLAEEEIPELIMIEPLGIPQSGHRKEKAPLARFDRPSWVSSHPVISCAPALRWVLWM
jgi:hypothetical protein